MRPVPCNLTPRERVAHYAANKIDGRAARWAAWTLKDRVEHFSFPEPNSGCWLWTGELDTKGYGAVVYLGRRYGAHRASWIVAKGEIPAGLCVLHKCDNPACVNPDHLFLGTKADNMADMIAKGRAIHNGPAKPRRGEECSHAKVTAKDVIAIRAASGPQHNIARAYGISPQQVSRIKRGVRWAHVAAEAV